MPAKCPHCGKVAYPAKDEAGNIIWKNVFKIDWMIVFLVLGIVSMMFGMYQTNQKCYDIVKNPCNYLQYWHCGHLEIDAAKNDYKQVFDAKPFYNQSNSFNLT